MLRGSASAKIAKWEGDQDRNQAAGRFSAVGWVADLDDEVVAPDLMLPGGTGAAWLLW